MKQRWLWVSCLFMVMLAAEVFAQGLNFSRQDHDFRRIDTAISSLPVVSNVQEVAGAIARYARDDWEKARGAYVWVARNIDYDVESFFSGTSGSTTAEATLHSRKAVCYGYSSLFAEIAQMLGLQVKTIEGYAKGYAYKAGGHFDKPNHAWNAVKLDGSWRLIDTTWGAGFVEQRDFVRHFTDAWFDTDPRLFLYNHFPEERSWTLLDHTMSLPDYVQAPMLEGPVLIRLIEMGFQTKHIIEISRHLPLPPLFESFAKAFLANGGKAEHMLSFLAQGELPSMWSYAGYPAQLIKYPTESILRSGEHYEFAVRIAHTERVIVSNDGDFTLLERNGDLFVGKVKARPGTLKLSADIEYDKAQSYWPLISWKVQ